MGGNPRSTRCRYSLRLCISSAGGTSSLHATPFMLERARCVRQRQGESGFYIFHRLLTGASRAQQKLLGLRLPEGESFRFYSGPESFPFTERKVAKRELVKLEEAMVAMGLSDAIVQELWSLLAAILHLGQVRFIDTPEGTQVDDQSAVLMVADLLALDLDALEDALVNERVTTRDEDSKKPRTVASATESRDQLAMVMYERLLRLLYQHARCVADVAPEGNIQAIHLL